MFGMTIQQISNGDSGAAVRAKLNRVLSSHAGDYAQVGATVVSPGQVVYIDGAGSLQLARADAFPTSRACGVALETHSAGFMCAYQSQGEIALADWTLAAGTALLQPGLEYYLSLSEAGKITPLAPETVGWIVPVGKAVSRNVLLLEFNTRIKRN